jgi:hypothetical protein
MSTDGGILIGTLQVANVPKNQNVSKQFGFPCEKFPL